MWLTQRVVEEINRDGGIFIKAAGKKLPVKVKVVDTQSDPNTSAEMASKLILGDKIDLMVVLHTPNTVDPVTSMSERYQMPCIALDSPLDSFIQNADKWAFLASGTWSRIFFRSIPECGNRSLPTKGWACALLLTPAAFRGTTLLKTRCLPRLYRDRSRYVPARRQGF